MRELSEMLAVQPTDLPLISRMRFNAEMASPRDQRSISLVERTSAVQLSLSPRIAISPYEKTYDECHATTFIRTL